jgi:hypothetical protein
MNKLILILSLLFTQILYSQTGTLEGYIKDYEGDTVPYTNVLVYQGDVMLTGTQADLNGKYIIKNLNPGTYHIKFSCVGYNVQTAADIVISKDKVTHLDAILTGPIELDDIVIEEKKVMACYSIVTVDALKVTAGVVYYGKNNSK